MKPSLYAYAIVALCVLIGMAEGYDAQAMAYAAPLVSRVWGTTPGAMGVLLAASIVAMVAANFLLAPLGDRWGRRPSILLALALAAIGTIAGAYAPDYNSMLISRIIAGFGLGLAFPTVIALAMEVMPRRLHAVAVVLVGCGYPVGGAIGGSGAAALIDTYGHPAVFLLGGGTTALLFLLCLIVLPESPLWLARHIGRDASLDRMLRRLGVALSDRAQSFGIREPDIPQSSVAALFTAERRSRTLLLWLINFANLSMVYFYIIWLPSILVNAGQGVAFAASALALFSGAGVIGGLLLALMLRRSGAGVALGVAYSGAITLVALLSTLSVTSGSFLAVLALSGAFVVGSQFCLNAVVNQYYTSAIRATASGYASGAGRVGAVVAPLVGALVVSPANPHWLAIGIGVVPAGLALGALVTLVIAAPLEAKGK